MLEAYQLACSLHDGQVDKAGRLYIEHLTRTYLRVQAAGGDIFQQIAALLHDAIENGCATAEDLLRIANVPAEAVDPVVVLTRRPSQLYTDYIASVKANERNRGVSNFLRKSKYGRDRQGACDAQGDQQQPSSRYAAA